jgi:hypothetical protein
LYKARELDDGARFGRGELRFDSFLMVKFWESEATIRGFAGDDISVAKYYDFDRGWSNWSRTGGSMEPTAGVIARHAKSSK